jgi:hypothetical protein
MGRRRPRNGIPHRRRLGYRLSSLPGVTAEDHGNSTQTVLRIAYTGKNEVIATDMLGVFNREKRPGDGDLGGGVAFSMRVYSSRLQLILRQRDGATSMRSPNG